MTNKVGCLVVQTIVSLLVGIIALVISLLTLMESSPLHDGSIAYAWALLNFGAIAIAILIEGNPHSFSETIVVIVIFVQWFILSFVICCLMSFIVARRRRVR
jgi:hypothetical protein